MPKPPFVHPGMRLPFALLVTCFAAWGIAANMTDPLVQVFSRIFSMSTLQASFVQFAYYGAYFLLALPAAFINRRFLLQDRHPDGPGLRGGGRLPVLSGGAGHDLRVLPGRAVPAGGGAVDP
ncbi:hypothetical protein [Paracoccus sp. NBH48]|uniref:hypothetical protein n=1 Tax=Paracoccus sp. NBH48 TaxID=2596918 RepID=UPI00210393EE|nr:hypothetical protein [Paracoccus sp. NBH48]